MHTRSRRTPRQNTLLFEELEPRLLFSADAAEALTGMAVEQSVDEEPEVAAAEEPAADSADQPAAQDQPGETAATEAAPQLLEGEAPAEADPAAAAPSPTGDTAVPADIDPAQPVEESAAHPAAAETLEPVGQAVVDGDQAAAAQELAPPLVEPVATGEPVTLIDSNAAVDEPTATADSVEPAAASELVFVDAAVRDGQTLVNSLLAPREDGRSFAVVVLDAGADGIDQVSATLQDYDNLQAIHFLSHGGDGELLLGSTRLDSTSLPLYTDAIAAWGAALADSGDILLYGCDISASADGRFLVEQISQLTGADVAASTDSTGLAALGGDWDLEYVTGAIEAQIAISADMQSQWENLLATVTSNGSVTSAQTANGTSLSWSHTVNSGTNRALFVQLAIDGLGASVTSVTYGGVAMTQVGRSTGNHAVEIWALVNPAITTANVVATFAGSTAAVGGAATFNGVDQTVPYGKFLGATGTGTTASVTVESTTGDVVFDVQYWKNTGANIVGSGQTSQWSQLITSRMLGGSTTEAGAASVTMTGTSGTSSQWEIGAVSIKAAAAVAPTNTAPALDGLKSPTLNALLEDAGLPVGAVGTLVASLVDPSSPAGGLDNVTDPDSGALTGIAVTAVDTANGAWWYSINNGATWSALGTVSDASARLLAADTATRLYFQPTPDWNGTFDAITFRAWDRTSGSNGTLADTTDNGGSTAFSTATDTATLTVTPVNDAPALDNSGEMTLMTITEDQTTNSGNTVAEIIASAGGDRITDVDAEAVEGIAVTNAIVTTGTGTWQYSLDNGTTWASVGAVADTSALLLRAEDRVRFLPDAMNGAEGTLAFRAWDQSTGSAGSTVDVSTTGGSTAFSTATETASITVTAVNDAPTVSDHRQSRWLDRL